MCEENSIDRVRFEREWQLVSLAVAVTTLKNPAVDEYFMTPRLQQIARTRDLLGGAEKMKFHVSKIVARPRNVKKPTISVNVVAKTVEARAGSIFSFFMVTGISTPPSPAMNRFAVIATSITKAS